MQNEYIDYEQVRNGANEILECANRMQDIFDSVAGAVNIMTSEDTFRGTASDALKSEFEPFRAQFANYVTNVREFANLYTKASESIETAEHDIKRQAGNIGQ